MVRDPVCEMEIDPTSAAGQSIYRGQKYFFCSDHCRRKFEANPAEFVDGHGHRSHAEAASATAPGKAAKKFFCPMCESVESDQPGSCPKCGMALERSLTFRELPKVIYTCPMHPQIEQDHPGNCPICGMALEPKNVGAEGEGENAELRNMRRRFWIAAALSTPVFILTMWHLLPSAPHWVNGD